MDIRQVIRKLIAEDQTAIIKTKGGQTITKDIKKTSDVNDLKNNPDISSIETGSGQKIKEAQEILDIIGDDEGRMAKSQLYKLAKYSIELHNQLKNNDQLEAWVQAKITTASDYISAVKHYLEHESLHKGEVDERKLTKGELGKREKIVKGLKKAKSSFEKTYGKDEAKNVMYAVATKRAKNEGAKFTSQYNDNPKLKGKQKELPDALQRAIIGEDETKDPQEIMVGSYQTRHFDICPGASALYKDIESKVDDMDLAERAAKLQDTLFYLEKHTVKEMGKATQEDVFMAQNLADQIMAMASMMGLEDEHQYIQGHVDAIKKIASSSLNEGFNPKDVVKMDVPLLIRMLEYAREDAKTDMDLHDVAENLIALSANGQTLDMNHYNKIVDANESY